MLERFFLSAVIIATTIVPGNTRDAVLLQMQDKQIGAYLRALYVYNSGFSHQEVMANCGYAYLQHFKNAQLALREFTKANPIVFVEVWSEAINEIVIDDVKGGGLCEQFKINADMLALELLR